MTAYDDIIRLEDACRVVWAAYEQRMKRLHVAAGLPDLPPEEMQRCACEVREALDLYLFLKRRLLKLNRRHASDVETPVPTDPATVEP